MDEPVSSPAPRFPTPFQVKTGWRALTMLSITVIATLLIGLIWLASYVLGFLQPLLVPIAVAGILAYLLTPLIRKLEARGVKTFTAVMIVFSGFMLFLILLALSVIPATYSQASRLLDPVEREKIVTRVRAETTEWAAAWGKLKEDGNLKEDDEAPTGEGTETEEELDPTPDDEASPVEETEAKEGESSSNRAVRGIVTYLDNPDTWENLKDEFPDIASSIGRFFYRGVQGFIGFLGYMLGLFLVPFYLFFFLKESHSISAHWSDYVPLKASSFKDEVVGTLQEINGYLIAFFRGQMLVSIIDGILISICLMIIGMPYALLIGVFVAILGLIPYLGNLLCLIPAMIISVAHFSVEANQIFGIEQIWIYPLIIVAIFTVTQQMNSLITAPKIVGDAVGLHPLTVIFSVFFWTLLMGGFLGSLLAVPLTASVKVLFRRYVWETRFSPPPSPMPKSAPVSS